MVKFALKTAINSASIYLASNLIPGFTFEGDLFILVGIGLALAAFQLFIYPVIKILAFPLVLLSLGFFGFIVNVVVLWGIAYYIPQLTIDGIVPLILGSVVLSTSNLLFSWL
jgi:putative membrane protein